MRHLKIEIMEVPVAKHVGIEAKVRVCCRERKQRPVKQIKAQIRK
jgi:hypothetical protein